MESLQILKGYPALSEKYGLHNWLEVEFDGWKLVGSGTPYSDCGTWRYRGCLNISGHNIIRLDGVRVHGRTYIQRYKRCCLRSSCAICYEKWSGKEAKKATKRFNVYASKSRAVHVIISPHGVIGTFSELKKTARKLLKNSGIYGGMMIFHPFRQDKLQNWYYSPHFHVLGYGWVKDSSKIFNETGWIIKNLGVRKSIYATISYQLSHSGNHKKNHTVTWFGTMSYNKLKVKQDDEPKHLCPICELELVEVIPFAPNLDSVVVQWSGDEGYFEPNCFKAASKDY